MSASPRPTVDELFEVLKRSSLPTVLVEGKNDIIFYRRIESDLRDLGVDMLPAGNKDAVLELRKRLRNSEISPPCGFVVDRDLWVYNGVPQDEDIDGVITTRGYSIENDLFSDGNLLALLLDDEKDRFLDEVRRFCRWYALAISRCVNGMQSPFRTHPGKVLDDGEYYLNSVALAEGEDYPEDLYNRICDQFSILLRGKSLIALIQRQLSRQGRKVKFSEAQILEFGASQRGENYERLSRLIREFMQQQLEA